jgi:hypothetical protein
MQRPKGHGVSLVQAPIFASHRDYPFFMDQFRIFDTTWPSVELVAASELAEEILIPAIRPSSARSSRPYTQRLKRSEGDFTRWDFSLAGAALSSAGGTPSSH